MDFRKIAQNIADNKKMVISILSAFVAFAICIAVIFTLSKKPDKNLVAGDTTGDIATQAVTTEETRQTLKAKETTALTTAAETQAAAAVTAQETTQAQVAIKEKITEAIQETEHIHAFTVEKIISPSCEESGYTLFKCNGCGEEYTGKYIDPRHSYSHFGKCTICKRRDPRVNTIIALSDWLDYDCDLISPSFNGLTERLNIEENTNYYLGSLDRDYHEPNVSLTYSSGELFYDIEIDQNYNCKISYYLYIYNNEAGMYYHAGLSAKKTMPVSELSSSMNFSFDECDIYDLDNVIQGNPKFTKEAAEADFIANLGTLLHTIEDKLLYPNTGLTLQDLGFTSY